MLIYATLDDLAAYTGQPAPDAAVTLLHSASARIRNATRAAVYPVQSNGLPLDDDLADALRDAVCAQAATWAALGVDPVKGAAGAKGVKTSSSVDGASVQYATYAAQAELLANSATTLADDAAAILTDAGLLSGNPFVFG